MKIVYTLLIVGLMGISSLYAQNVSISKDMLTYLNLAGKNKPELIKVINHYSRDKADLEKLEAACYLIKNMRWHKRNYREIIPDPEFIKVFKLADSLYYELVKGLSSDQIHEKSIKDKISAVKNIIQEKISKSSFQEPKISLVKKEYASDLEAVTCAFLIDHIDNAFDLKEKSELVKALPREEFYSYTLPYRILDGQNFRYSGREFNYFFAKYLGNVSSGDFTEIVSRYNLTVNNLRNILGNYPFLDRTGFEELFFHKVSEFDCFSVSNYGAAALNACGVPVDVEYNVAYQMLQDKHSHCRINQRFGVWTSFSPESGTPAKRSGKYETFGGLGLMNLFRVQFSGVPIAPFFLKNKDEYIPSNLDNPRLEDVTAKSLQTFSIEIPYREKTKNKLCYLATFNTASGIVPVTWGIINNLKKTANFDNVIPDRLYFPIYYRNDTATSFGSPFYLKLDSSQIKHYKICHLSDFDKTTGKGSFVVTRKFPRKPKMITVAENLVGTTVLGFDSLKGKIDTLFTLNFVPSPFLQDVDLRNKKSYKNYRVQAPAENPHLNISEIQFLTLKNFGYLNTCTPAALPIFEPKKSVSYNSDLVRVIQDSLEKISKGPEYDGKMDTAPSAYPNVTLKLKIPQVITTLRFAPLNANNGIVPGDTYLLKYLDNGQWNDFEFPVTAEFNFLKFSGVPKGKLYWLRNLSSGKEELPFMISKDGKQQFIYFDIK